MDSREGHKKSNEKQEGRNQKPEKVEERSMGLFEQSPSSTFQDL